ncbi:membrane protein [Nocardia neocaledoniensis NBRC 108232]|uniref:CBS domain containing-hemolysin-like protein n=1 Tax=Nocardia neocaledoniensis TaxID=236511 RepID=A0A317NAG6_9NOCA|nr:hemolysin family protein [Nocardia neocaledoniensis]PWV72301.1 CBS domain containing-hemolysin-like protein [Nocardia neocaledoniensis]GEM31844.1 membrane protein [Nocardia neocaledoniensis NBRC 108232]
MLTVLSVVAGVVVVMLITAVTGYFVAQEFAYMAVDRSRLAAQAEAGDASAGRALAVTRRTSFMLSGAQLGITVTGLLVGYVAEPLIGRGLGELFGGIGVPTAVGVGVGTVLAIGFSTIVQMLFGELFPKNLAIARPEPVARWLARSTTWYLRVFGWLIWLFDQSSNVLLRALRIEPVHDVEHSATPRDLEHIVAASRDAGELPRELSTLLDRILDFPSATAEHAMIPRSQVDLVDAEEPVAAVLARMSTGHTRYPVVGRSSDDLLGTIELHDLLGATPTGTASDHLRHAVLVPESLALPEVVAQLEEAGQEMALVVDEYGGFAGIVTVEDIAEELVGEIADEHDSGTSPQIVADRDGWLVPGEAHIDEVERVLEVDLPAGDYETVAGLVIHAFGGLPVVGDRVEIGLPRSGADFLAETLSPARVVVAEVRAVGKHVPSSVWLSIHTERDGGEGE